MRLKTSFEFDSAHRLVGYEGKCSNLHGHIWKVEIEVIGKDLDNIGMLWDFTNVKALKDKFDHKTILKECIENIPIIDAIIETCGDGALYLMKDNPTAENLCEEILRLLDDEGSPKLEFKVTVWESPKSSCEAIL